MKKYVLLIAFALCGATAFAQKIDKNELSQLKSFLLQTDDKGKTNAQELKISDLNSPASWHGVTVANGHVTAIDWQGKRLIGELTLNNFKALESIDVSRNRLSMLSLTRNGVLLKLNASHNMLTQIDLTGCDALTHVAINNNRLTDFIITEVPALKYLNCSQNLFVQFDARNAVNLQTLYVQDCRLENLYVDGC